VSLQPGLWQRPERLGHQEALKGLGGSVAPFLAGFSLATIALLVTADHSPRLAGPAVLALATSVSLLLYSMQTAFLALEHSASAADWLGWYPEATVNELSLADIRRRQAAEHIRVKAAWRVHAITYELGLAFFLAGLFMLIWPRFPAHGHPSVWRLCALVPVALAFIVEVWWMVARLYNARQKQMGTGKKQWRGPTPTPAVETPTVSDLTSTELAAVLDAERRGPTKLSYPDLSGEPGADLR
jgi:hypothetical protein